MQPMQEEGTDQIDIVFSEIIPKFSTETIDLPDLYSFMLSSKKAKEWVDNLLKFRKRELATTSESYSKFFLNYLTIHRLSEIDPRNLKKVSINFKHFPSIILKTPLLKEKILDEIKYSLLKNKNSLESLSLTHLTEDSLFFLESKYQKNPQKHRDWWISFLGQLKEFQNLRRLDLSNNHVGDQTGKVMADSLSQLKNLTFLDLSWNNFEDQSGQEIAIGLQSCSKLDYLDLKGNKDFGKQGRLAITKAITLLSELTYLDLSWNYFGAAEEKELADSIEKLTKLKHLNLEKNSFYGGGEKIAKAIVKLQFLNYLNLNQCQLGAKEESAIKIAQALRELPKLNFLDLNGNSFTNLVGSHIAESLEKLEELRYLDLSDNSFENDIRIGITAVIQPLLNSHQLSFMINQ